MLSSVLGQFVDFYRNWPWSGGIHLKFAWVVGFIVEVSISISFLFVKFCDEGVRSADADN